MNIDTDKVPNTLQEVAWLFDNEGFTMRLVGGCVRDMLCGRDPKDWDCATDALPQQTFDLLERGGFNPFDISNGHGTVSFIADGDTFEITTLRLDVETDGRHAEVEFISDFEADAARRDFTINAMSADPISGQVFDYFNGQQDLENQTIRFVGDPRLRIEEDALRILRYFRFLGKMQFYVIDWPSMDACREGRKLLANISGERVWMEVKQILSFDDYQTIMRFLQAADVDVQLGLR